MADWVAIGPDEGGIRACAMQGDTLVFQRFEANDAAAMAGLGYRADQPVIRIGEGVPDTLPSAVGMAPGTGLAGFVQQAPPDVIGAWVRLQLMGLLAEVPQWDGVVCALGQQISHWMHVSADELVSCQSFLTPRLITHLGGGSLSDPTAVGDSLSRPERLAAHLRVAEVSGNNAATTGHLIGVEIAATRAYWLGQQVVLIADDGQAVAYQSALDDQGVPVSIHDPEKLRAKGLAALSKTMGYS